MTEYEAARRVALELIARAESAGAELDWLSEWDRIEVAGKERSHDEQGPTGKMVLRSIPNGYRRASKCGEIEVVA